MAPVKDRANLAESFSDIRADYDAMRTSDFVRNRVGLPSLGGGSDYHIRQENKFFELIERARDLCRNAPIIERSMVQAADNVVGDGFTICPDTGDSEIDNLLFRKWNEWANDAEQCDIAGEHTFDAMAHMMIVAALRDGEKIAIGTQEGALQLVEAHQCRNPRRNRWNKDRSIVNGVEIDKYRRHIRYHIRPEPTDPNKSIANEKSTAYDVRDRNGVRVLFHFMLSHRSTATRGVTALAACFQKIAMFDDLDFAKLVQAQALSCIVTQKIKNETKYQHLPVKGSARLGPVDEKSSPDLSVQQLRPGTHFENAHGERLEALDHDVPNTNYFEHAKMLLTMFFLSIGLPYVMGMMDASATNFSGWRAAVDEAKKGFRRIQRRLKEKTLSPIYTWKVHQFIADDPEIAAAYARVGDKIFNHKWRLPRWPYVQPVEDATGRILRQKSMLSSPRRLHGEESQDFEEIVDETVADNSYAIKAALSEARKLNEEFKPNPPITWRDLISLPVAEGMSISVSTQPMQDSNQQSGVGNGSDA